MVEHGEEHRGHAADDAAALGGNCFERGERVEPLRGEDHGGAVDDAQQCADDHAAAMIERHLDAEPVPFHGPHTLADEIGVVEDVAMAEGGALRRTGRARGELDVDGIRVLLRRRTGGEFGAVAGSARAATVSKRTKPGASAPMQISQRSEGARTARSCPGVLVAISGIRSPSMAT